MIRFAGFIVGSGLNPKQQKAALGMEGIFTRRLKRLLSCAILVLVAWGIYRTVVDALGELENKPIPWQLDPFWLGIAALLYLGGTLPLVFFWHRSLRAVGCRPRFIETMRAYCVGSLGRYVPGKALVLVLRTRLLYSERSGATATTVSIFLETLTMMAVGAFLASLMLVFWLDDHLRDYPFLLPLAIGLLLLAGLPTWPAIFRRIVLRLGTARLDETIEQRLSGIRFSLMVSGWLCMVIAWILFAGSLWSVVRGMGLEREVSGDSFPYFLAAITMAVVAGFLSLIPGGAGVREYMITVILGHFYFAEVLELPFAAATALLAAVLLRMIWLAVEFLLAVTLYPMNRASPQSYPLE